MLTYKQLVLKKPSRRYSLIVQPKHLKFFCFEIFEKQVLSNKILSYLRIIKIKLASSKVLKLMLNDFIVTFFNNTSFQKLIQIIALAHLKKQLVA